MSAGRVADASDIHEEAQRLAAAASDGRLPARLMGGLAIWLTSPTARRPPYARPYRDIDLVAASRDRKAVAAFLESTGYVGDRLFNALHGAQRMVFGEPAGRWSVDLVFDALAMSHRIDLRSRLSMSGPTLDLADLVLTKLQVWEINEKDLGDVACLLADHPLGGAATASADHTAIDLDRLTSLLGSDWGLCHTVERNLARVAELWASTPAPGSPHDVGVQVATLVTAIEGAPKSIGWRARARVGERVRWYETPEEVRR